MWTSTLESGINRVLLTRLLGNVWPGAYFSSFAPLQVKNLPRHPLASTNSNWVRVRNRLSGISESDLPLVFANRDPLTAPAALPTSKYIYPGHEVVGEVIEIGDQVRDLGVGDRVVLQCSPNCLSAGIQPPCDACATGNYNLCENGDIPGPQQIGGGWSEEMLVHEQQLFRIPPEMEDEQAVLLEPTAMAIHAVLRHLPLGREKVLVVGGGSTGLLILQAVRTLAPQVEVSVLTRHNFEVEQATRMGAAHILYSNDSYENVEKTTGARLYTGAMGNKMLLGGYDLIFDTMLSRQTIHDSLRWTRAGGTVILVGANLHRLKIDLSPIWHQEVCLFGTSSHGMEYWPVGTSQQRSTFAIASDMISHGLLHPEKLITHRFALSSFRDAFQVAMHKDASSAIKVIFDAALLPASSVPNTRAIPARHSYQTHDFQQDQLSQFDGSFPIPAGQNTPSTGPSHFTMAQSEDFTADFDDVQFINPRPRRPPAALQFHNTTDEITASVQAITPKTATNSAPETLKAVEGLENDSASAQQN